MQESYVSVVEMEPKGDRQNSSRPANANTCMKMKKIGNHHAIKFAEEIKGLDLHNNPATISVMEWFVAIWHCTPENAQDWFPQVLVDWVAHIQKPLAPQLFQKIKHIEPVACIQIIIVMSIMNSELKNKINVKMNTWEDRNPEVAIAIWCIWGPYCHSFCSWS